MKTLSHVLSVFILVIGSMAHSALYTGDYNQQLGFLQGALGDLNLNLEDVYKYQNPFVGNVSFTLPSENAPWGSYNFDLMKGGVARRWQYEGDVFPDPDHLYSKKQLQSMSREQLDKLSPIEKLDIMLGHYNFPATKHELFERGPYRGYPWPPLQDWEGHCGGLRCASVVVPEPSNPVEVTNKDGITLTFMSADIKILAGVSYSFVEKYKQIGQPELPTQDGLRPNPALFDLTLRYFLAENKRPFITDSHLGKQIWNEAVLGYKRNLGKKKSLTPEEANRFPWAASKVQVTGYVETLGDIPLEKTDGPTTQKVVSGELMTKIPIAYTLYLDSEGRALDGVWHSKKGERGVAWIWFPAGKGEDSLHEMGNPSLEFDAVKDLLKKSRKGNAKPAVRSCGILFKN
jgi:hypothetical protein